MPGCRTSNFDRSFCVGSPAQLLEKSLQMLCTARTGSEDEDAVGSPFLHWKPFFDLSVCSCGCFWRRRCSCFWTRVIMYPIYKPKAGSYLALILRVLKLYYKVASSQLPAPQITPRTKVVLQSCQFSSSSSPETPRAQVVLQSCQCLHSRTRHARSPQRVARTPDKSHSRLHFAHSTRTISAEGRARSRHAALSPAFRALDTTISADGCSCAGAGQIALSPAFRALGTHDLRRGSRGNFTHRTLACISRTRHARSPQRVAR